jgi:hypothetical protein
MNFYTVGALIPRKNIIKTIISVLIVNLLYRKKHTLTIYGDGPLRLIVLVMSKIFDAIIFRGYINKEVLLNHINHFDAFLLFSKREAFGLVYIEALKEAIPIGCLKDEGISDLIEDFNLGVTSTDSSIKKICSSILKLNNYCINKVKLRKALNEFNKEVVLKTYLNQ